MPVNRPGQGQVYFCAYYYSVAIVSLIFNGIIPVQYIKNIFHNNIMIVISF